MPRERTRRFCLRVVLATVACAGGVAAADAVRPSLVVTADGNRLLGKVTLMEAALVCGEGPSEIRIPLASVEEIVGPHSDAVEVSPRARIEHRCPELGSLLSARISRALVGEPEGLDLIKADDRWEIWSTPGKQAKKDAAELLKHLKRIINKMDVFFPRAERPEEPCKVRVFEDSATFLAWRDRGKSLDTHSLWVTAIADFFLAENAIILADFHDSDQGIATKAEQYRQRLRERLDSARDPADLLRLEIAVGALAHSFAIQDREKIAVTLDWFLHGEDDDSSAGRTPPRAPRADPTEGGEATFINYGYYSSATEELVLWKSDEFWTTVSHETFHYFLEHNCPEAPIWINEGFATYFETFSPLQRDKFQGFHFDRWGELKTGPERGVPFVGLDDLLLVDIGTWQAQEGPLQSYLYAESWAFLHFLLHSDEFDFGNKGRKLLIGYLELLSDGKSPEEAMKESFTGEFSLETLEPKFMNYVNRLKRPDW